MASYLRKDSDLKQCPYNAYHRVKPSAFSIHLSKCEKSYGHLYERCPFNDNHRIKKEEFKSHLLNCNDNRQMFRQFEYNSSVKKQKTENTFTNVHKWKTEDEWSDEYLKPEEMVDYVNPLANEVLLKDGITAEQAFNITFRSPEVRNGFTDPLLLSRMTFEERTKYYKLLANKTMEEKAIMIGSEREESNGMLDKMVIFEKLVESEIETKADVSEELIPSKVFRIPTCVPFQSKGVSKKMGIGRGVAFPPK